MANMAAFGVIYLGLPGIATFRNIKEIAASVRPAKINICGVVVAGVVFGAVRSNE